MLGVPDLLQDTPRILQVLREQIFLLRHLGQQHAELVADLTDGIVVGALAPLAQLGGDGLRLLAGLLVGADGVVLRLDEGVEALGQLGLAQAAQAAHVELVRGAALVMVVASAAQLGADGGGPVPGACARQRGACRGGTKSGTYIVVRCLRSGVDD